VPFVFFLLASTPSFLLFLSRICSLPVGAFQDLVPPPLDGSGRPPPHPEADMSPPLGSHIALVVFHFPTDSSFVFAIYLERPSRPPPLPAISTIFLFS